MKHIIFVLTLLFSNGTLLSQIATINGCVIDSVSGKTIEGASITIIDNGDSPIKRFGGKFTDAATSDADGDFECSGMVIGRYYKVFIATDDWNTVHIVKIQSVKMRLNFIICTKSDNVL